MTVPATHGERCCDKSKQRILKEFTGESIHPLGVGKLSRVGDVFFFVLMVMRSSQTNRNSKKRTQYKKRAFEEKKRPT